MIKYNLTCECGKNFESWFSSSSRYDFLRKKGHISCIYCGSTSVSKSIMAPNLSSKSNKNHKKNRLDKNVRKELIEFRKFIEKNCRDDK